MNLLRSVLAVLALVATPVLALADQSATKPNDLPGVQGGHSIVRKEPPPEPEPASAKDDGVYRYGDWEVHVSGSVSVEIGFGQNPSRSRR